MDFKEKTLEKQYVYNGKIINVRKDKVIFPDDKTSYREVVEHKGGSCVLCEKDDKILLVSQYRYAIDKTIWEIPAGKKDEGETSDITAIRELEEECGYRAKSVELLYSVYPTPGYDNELIYIYKAKDIVKTQTNFDEGEYIESKWFSKQEIKEMLKTGEINDAKTIIALLTALK